MTIEQKVIEHYGSHGIADTIFSLLGKRSGISVEELSPYDEMHIGGRPATEHFINLLDLQAGMSVLDVGCGIGGAARYTADKTDSGIIGIDLTPDFIDTAIDLTMATDILNKPVFQVASALDLPFEGEIFDAAYMIHAGMNIEDKAGVYREVFRVLKTGSVFGIYDIMGAQGDNGFQFPVPWAESAETSFLVPSKQIASLLEEAGFEIVKVENRRDFALGVFKKMQEMEEAGKVVNVPSPIRNVDFPRQSANLAKNVANSLCAPCEIICRKA